MLSEREQATHCEGCSTASTSTRPGCASALIWVCATRALYCLRMRSSQATQFENGAALSWMRAQAGAPPALAASSAQVHSAEPIFRRLDGHGAWPLASTGGHTAGRCQA